MHDGTSASCVEQIHAKKTAQGWKVLAEIGHLHHKHCNQFEVLAMIVH